VVCIWNIVKSFWLPVAMLACGLLLLRHCHCESLIADGHGIGSDRDRIDFGTFPVGKIAPLRFTIMNETCDALELQSLTTSCGCTEGVCEPKVVPMGSRAEVTLNVSARGSPGRFSVLARLSFRRSGTEDLLFVQLLGEGEFTQVDDPTPTQSPLP